MDLIFCVLQLVEKAIEHNTKVFLLFVDLCKAYPVLRFGIPENLNELMHSFHKGMLATVTICRETFSPFLAMNGLYQGCTIVPTLFILNLGLVIQCWCSNCQAIGIEVQH